MQKDVTVLWSSLKKDADRYILHMLSCTRNERLEAQTGSASSVSEASSGLNGDILPE